VAQQNTLENVRMMCARTGCIITFGQIATCLPVLDVACNRCDRRARHHVDRPKIEQVPLRPYWSCAMSLAE
jgi:hypothetical protein